MTFDNTPAQVVVIEDRKRKKGLAWLAGGAALALLLSGGTFALWRASASFTGGQVTAGDLDLTGCANDEITWWDISPDRADATEDLSTTFSGIDFTESVLLDSTDDTDSINALALAKSEYTTYPAALTSYLDGTSVMAHEIDDIETWKMVPGDTIIAVCQDAIVSLEGDNLVAALTLTDETGAAISFDENSDPIWNGVVVGSEIFANGELADPGENGELGYFGAPGPNGGQEEGVDEEENGVTELVALQSDGTTAATADSNADDLRTSTTDDGRMSLGQGYVSALFVVHFIDDGIDGHGAAEVVAAEATCEITPESEETGWTDEDHSTPDNCDGVYSPAVDGSAAVYGYIPDAGGSGTGDASNIANNRYLATQVLAKLANGRLVLKQVRDDGVGQFVTPSAP